MNGQNLSPRMNCLVSMEFENGSRIVSATTTGNTGRGMSISLLYCDEFAFVNPNIAEEFWTSISPTLATGGHLYMNPCLGALSMKTTSSIKH